MLKMVIFSLITNFGLITRLFSSWFIVVLITICFLWFLFHLWTLFFARIYLIFFPLFLFNQASMLALDHFLNFWKKILFFFLIFEPCGSWFFLLFVNHNVSSIPQNHHTWPLWDEFWLQVHQSIWFKKLSGYTVVFSLLQLFIFFLRIWNISLFILYRLFRDYFRILAFSISLRRFPSLFQIICWTFGRNKITRTNTTTARTFRFIFWFCDIGRGI